MERDLDVRGLPAPEPMERILEALEGLPPGDRLRVLHWREPFPLYELLEAAGYRWETRAGREAPYEIHIWRATDERRG